MQSFKDYYVYLHRRKDNNIVFYVGKGNTRSKRSSRKERSKNWHRVVKDSNGFEVEFYKTGLSEQEALDLEFTLINNPLPEWNLINCHKNNSIKNIPDSIKDAVYYDITSKSCLRWKIKTNRSDIGKEAGTKLHDYWSIEYKGVGYLVHRIILFLHSKLEVGKVVNHKNCIRSDNRLENLECISISENNRRQLHHINHGVRADNSSGVNGVSEKIECGRYFYALVEWYDEYGVKRCKRFSYLKFGKEIAWEKAIAFRKIEIERIENARKPNTRAIK